MLTRGLHPQVHWLQLHSARRRPWGHNLLGLTSQKLQILALTRFLHANQHPILLEDALILAERAAFCFALSPRFVLVRTRTAVSEWQSDIARRSLTARHRRTDFGSLQYGARTASACRLSFPTMMIAPLRMANREPSSLGTFSVSGEGKGMVPLVTGSPTLTAGADAKSSRTGAARVFARGSSVDQGIHQAGAICGPSSTCR